MTATIRSPSQAVSFGTANRRAMLTATPKVSSARSALPATVSSRLSKTGATVIGVLRFPSRIQIPSSWPPV